MLFCDSTAALAWINADATQFKPYVKNKVIEIQDVTSVDQWRYIPSKKNRAADLLSKGCSREELVIIVAGPDILQAPMGEWNFQPTKPLPEEVADEPKSNEFLINVTMIQQPLIELERFSSWMKLIRVTAYVYRFTNRYVQKYVIGVLENSLEKAMTNLTMR